MAYSPILGHDDATPVLDPAGTSPVVMTSPCPYAQWSATQTDNPYGTVTSGANWWRVDAVDVNGLGVLMAGSVSLTVKMISTKADEKLRVTLTYGGDAGNEQAVITPYVGVTSQGATQLVAGTVTADIDVPYYRYSFTLFLQLQGNIPPATNGWARVDFSLI